MVRHQFSGSSGFDSHPEIFYATLMKNFEGGANMVCMFEDPPKRRR